MPRPKKGNHHRIYLRQDLESRLQEQAERTGVSVEDLIKIRLDESTERQEQFLNNLDNTVNDLNHKIGQIQLVMMRLCNLLESSLIDSAYTRGAIEFQAKKSPEAVQRAEELEMRRLQTSQRIREEVDRYL